MDLSVCILTHSQPVLLPKCVDSCVLEIQRAGLSGEIIIVDNASSDRYPEKVAATRPMVRVVRNEENMGFAVANNLAVKMSLGENVLLLNDDAILQERSLGLMMSELGADPRVGAVGPSLVFPDGSPQLLYMNKRLPHLRGMFCEFLGVDRRLRQKPWTRDWLTLWGSPEEAAEPEQISGACFLARRQAWDQVGGFDDQFYYVLDDADLCFRLRKAGWRFRCIEAARVTHFGGSTFARWDRLDQARNYYECVYAYFRKHTSLPGYLLVRAVLGFAVVLVFAEATFFGTLGLVRSRRTVTFGELARKTRGGLALLWSMLRVSTARGPRAQPSKN